MAANDIMVRIEACEAPAYNASGQVQAHGVLLAFDPRTLLVSRASANAAAVAGHPGQSLIGLPLAAVLAEESVGLVRIAAHTLRDTRTRAGLRVALICAPHVTADAVLYRSGALLCLELEHPAAPGMLSSRFFTLVERVARTDMPSAELPAIACDGIRDVTGFDRVYFCRFDQYGHGHVLGDSGNGALPRLLDHHFPATDIPQAARRIYLVNPFRQIPDVEAAPIDIVGDSGAALDLTMSTCRAVAPTHLQYLRNMGVAASFSLSVVRDGRLEAVFGGHNTTPRALSWHQMAICQHIVELFSTRLEFLRIREERNKFAQRLDALDALSAGFRVAAGDVGNFVAEHHAAICALVDADDVLCRFGGHDYLGRTLAANDAGELLDFLAERLATGDDVLRTDNLAGTAPRFAALCPTAAGAMAITLDLSRNNLIVWLRCETIVVQQWSGDPRHAAVIDGRGMVGPRTSFLAYIRETQGVSRAWANGELRLARHMRQTFGQVLASHYEVGMRRAAEQASALKSEFVANITHELRSPMHAIIGLSTLLADESETLNDDVRRRYAGTIRDSGARLLHLIEDLLDLSRFEAGRMDLAPASGDILAVLAGAAAEVDALARAKDISIETVDRRRQSSSMHDPARMHQVMINLLANAIAFGRPHSRILITLSTAESGPGKAVQVIEVADQGVGIPPNELTTVFEKFVQSSRTKSGAGGTGLGLAICRDIVQAHQGRIWAANNAEGGASLFVTIPESQGHDGAAVA